MKKVLLIFPIIILLLQFWPVDRTNWESTAELTTTADTMQILKKSCYDCHSFKTRWPWYSYVFPVSVWMKHHIKEGNENLNFSLWEKYTPREKSTLLDSIMEEVENKEMPLKSYTWMHGEALLNQTEINILKEWVRKESLKVEQK